jgi:DNA-binding MarR family transcriptional regulator
MIDLPNLDPVLHQTVRTRLAIALSRGPMSFSALKAALGLTDGNLDAHLRKFSAAGYLQSEMVVWGRVRTDYSLSASGAQAVAAYLRDLNRLIEAAASGGGSAVAGTAS